MRKITQKELDEIVERHQHWLKQDVDGWESMRADLSHTNLEGLNLDEVSLDEASLDGASLNRASLKEASLDGASLNWASLNWASLKGASLKGASLNGASLNVASLKGASLEGAINVPFIPMACPCTGTFTGWKKCENALIVKLTIPAEAKRSSATGRKCRCDMAIVESIENIDGSKANVDTAVSRHDRSFMYTVGQTVKADNFDENRFNECAAGIHFFINRQEAAEY